jgi:RNA polymerase sigma-70 factor, ECF subfamily
MAEIVLRVVNSAEDFAIDPANAPANSGEASSREWFDALFQAHYPRVVGMLGRLTGDRGQAEEIAADAFTKLSQQSSLQGDPGSWTAWVYRVAINAGLDALRSDARRKRREESAHSEQMRRTVPGALDGLLREERCALVQDVLSALKPRDAQLLLLRSSGLAYKELAETLGVPASSVGTMLARAEAEFERRFRAKHGESV